MRGTRSAGLLALGGIPLAAVLAVIGHLEANDDLSPWSLTVSDFAVSDRGGVIDAAMVVLAVATAALLPALHRAYGSASAARRRWAQSLLAVWGGGLLLAAVVPTNEPGLPMDTAAYVHRYASVVAFLALPAAGWLLAGPLPGAGRWLRGFALASLALAGAMVWSAYPGGRVLIGLVERLLILTEVGLLATVALWLVAAGQRRGFVAAGRRHPARTSPVSPRPVRRDSPVVTPARGA